MSQVCTLRIQRLQLVKVSDEGDCVPALWYGRHHRVGNLGWEFSVAWLRHVELWTTANPDWGGRGARWCARYSWVKRSTRHGLGWGRSACTLSATLLMHGCLNFLGFTFCKFLHVVVYSLNFASYLCKDVDRGRVFVITLVDLW